MPEDYDIMPHKEIERLRREIEALKKGNIKPVSSEGSMDKLADAVTELTQLFKTAGEEIKVESSADLSEKMDKLIKQNEEIARGILLIVELQRQHLPEIAKHTKATAQKTPVAPRMRPMPRPAPQPVLRPLTGPAPMEPFPPLLPMQEAPENMMPEPPKKRSFFGFRK